MFALAGLVAAAGPVIIHLLNRRRYRVVNWAAMDFLLEAVRRNRRMLHLRDLLLLALRTAAVLLFGLALARPMISNSASTADENQPVHAVLVVDNSLSMGYEKFDHTLLDESKSKAKEFLESLPEGSRISVLPLCGSAAGVTLDAYRTKEDARDALDRIEVVDRSGSGVQAIDAALDARRRVPEFKDATRVVFLGDQQAANWPAGGLSGLHQRRARVANRFDCGQRGREYLGRKLHGARRDRGCRNAGGADGRDSPRGAVAQQCAGHAHGRWR